MYPQFKFDKCVISLVLNCGIRLSFPKKKKRNEIPFSLSAFFYNLYQILQVTQLHQIISNTNSLPYGNALYDAGGFCTKTSASAINAD